MLWNWYTVGACFLSSEWHITSHGMFAGSCIGVICLVMSLEFLRRSAREWEDYLARHAAQKAASARSNPDSNGNNQKTLPAIVRPTILQGVIRALLHMLQFAVAYFVMLLAMYYNGYIIICIFIGAFLGYLVFSSFKPIAVKGSP